ncbi:3-phosphoinositide-dependent protein kinase [Hibiscus syriacus]|uniref:3-phosphoinositide-dependent protein kinase n=1 Tax=Hibiscus syriacus TaxID=106335 RepID=A0A6A2WXH7_HIBSY|nr:3-phosphoinositide-dependent protein kinase [Hibiscus syriacus]
MQGDIGVAKSVDKGATWQQLGIALDEEWHLSYPYVFNYHGQVYMMPEISQKLELQHCYFGTTNRQLEISYSSSPLGPWELHKKNPIYNTYSSFGALKGGRPFRYNGNLYRIGQDCGETYGRRVWIFKVEVLVDYKEMLKFRFPLKSTVRVGMPGMVPGVLVGAVNCIIPLNWCSDYSRKRSDSLIAWERANVVSSKQRRIVSRLNRAPSYLLSWIKPNTCARRSVLALVFALGVVLSCTGVTFIYGGSGPYSWKGQLSQFTLLTMSYDARLWNLKMFVNHYSRFASYLFGSELRVRTPSIIDSRLTRALIETRAVLELDEDIKMLLSVDLCCGGNILIGLGAAFIDSQVAFQRYWSEQAKLGREVVDAYFNCEDVLMNFLYANASLHKTVEYVRLAWVIDTSKLSSAAISRDTNGHYKIRRECLRKFTDMYGSMSDRRWEFNSRKDRWDV